MELNPPKRKNGEDLPFDWETLEDIMDKLNLNMSVFDKFRASSPATTVANTLALDYIVCYLGMCTFLIHYLTLVNVIAKLCTRIMV